jgi:hypothetical protein
VLASSFYRIMEIRRTHIEIYCICCIVLYRQHVSTLSGGHHQAIEVFIKAVWFTPTCRDPVRYRSHSSIQWGGMYETGYLVMLNWLISSKLCLTDLHRPIKYTHNGDGCT